MSDKPKFINQEFEVPGSSSPIRKLPMAEDPVPVTTEKPSETVEDIKVRKVVDLIKADNLTPKQAIKQAGLPPVSMMSRQMMERIKGLLEEAYMPADVQRAAVRAGRFKAFMQLLEQGLATNDTDQLRLAAEFSKQIGSDPDVGLNQPPAQVVNIDIGGLADVLRNVEPLPGFEKPVFDEEK